MNNQKSKLVVCIGVSGSGKTTLANALSNHLGWRYVEADDFHSQANREHMRSGQPLSEAMRRPWIKAIQSELSCLAEAAENCVLAFSGLRLQHRDAIRDTPFAKTVFLYANLSREVLHQRIQNRRDHFMPASLLESQLNTFELNEAEPNIHQLDGEQSPEQMVQSAIAILNT